MTAVDDALRKLGNKFCVIDLVGIPHMPSALLFTYCYELPFMDAVMLRGEDDSTAYRSRIDDDAVGVFPPGNVVWALAGPLVEVVDELFRLPEPGMHGAPSLVIRAPSSIWVPPGVKIGAGPPAKLSLET